VCGYHASVAHLWDGRTLVSIVGSLTTSSMVASVTCTARWRHHYSSFGVSGFVTVGAGSNCELQYKEDFEVAISCSSWVSSSALRLVGQLAVVIDEQLGCC